MKNVNNSRKISSLLLATVFCGLFTAAHAAVITQMANTTSSKDWNDSSTWGSAAVTGNTYLTTTGWQSSSSAVIGNTTYTSLLRENGVTFAGDSITLVSGVQLLLKQATNQVSSANIILNGGSIRHATGDNSLATVAGTMHIAAESFIGEGSGTNNNTSNAVLTISSTLTGSSILHLGAAVDPGKIAFTGNLSGFSGTLDIGNSGSSRESVTVSFNSADLSAATIKMGDYLTSDILDLSGSISLGVFKYSGITLGNGTYSVATLNSTFGNGSQFTGSGSITIGSIPEPSTYAVLMGLAGLTAGGMVRRRRR